MNRTKAPAPRRAQSVGLSGAALVFVLACWAVVEVAWLLGVVDFHAGASMLDGKDDRARARRQLRRWFMVTAIAALAGVTVAWLVFG